MNINSLSIPPEIVSEAMNYFSKSMIANASQALGKFHTSISFKKGDPETYYIVSGIIKDDRPHETKMVFKKRLVGTSEPAFTSNCDCHLWNETDHCIHVSLLFLTYHLQRYFEHAEKVGNSDISAPPISLYDNYAVTVDEYGTYIPGAHRLVGAPSQCTYSTLRYLLHNKKVVNFPIPESMRGKLIISMTSRQAFEMSSGDYAHLPRTRYYYQTPAGERIEEVSLFENLYLFNWRTGESFNLPTALKTLIQRIRINEKDLSINDLILLSTNLYTENVCELHIDGIPLQQIPQRPATLKITLEPADKNTQIKMNFIFIDQSENVIIPPEFLSMFTFEGGLLSSFKRKKDAYDFIRALAEYFSAGVMSYKQLLMASTQKKRWLDLIEFLEQNQQTYVYDAGLKSISCYDNDFLRKLIVALLSYFDEQIFRYSSFIPETQELSLLVAPPLLFAGLNRFYQALAPYGITIYYDRNEVMSWNSRVSFERKREGTKWFDLELNINQIDLQIIKSADLTTGVAFSAQGLVLLGQEEKDLLRFMKKYVQYEQQEMIVEQGEEGTINKFIIPFNRARIFELFELKKLGLEGALTEEEIKLCHNLTTLEQIPCYPIPPEISGTLREYQKIGHNWLSFLYENKLGACLADDMGLGKTLQTISFLQSIYHKIKRVLVVCPVTILLNWESELKKFSQMKMHIYHGGDRCYPEDAKIILTSYGVMKREGESTFSNEHFDVLILDEVQHLKNIRSIGAYAARKIQADFRICLTGTPVENDLAEFYNIIDLAVPGIWGDLQFIRTTSNNKSRLLARKTAAPFILRRTKGQVLSELPPKIEHTIPLEFSEHERSHYTQNLLNIRQRINEAVSKKKYGEILRGLLHLRQNCLWQKLPSTQEPTFGAFESVKVNFLVETLEQILEEGHQAIIFSQFTTYLDLIQGVMDKRHWRYSRIDGSQSINTRQKQVELFQEHKNPIFLISLKAGGVGLNLTAASYVFIMDPWWNPAVEQQAIDRAHRIGQENTLTVYRPIIKDSVEEKVLVLQNMKKQLFQDLLPDDDESFFTGKLSMKDFEHLFT